MQEKAKTAHWHACIDPCLASGVIGSNPMGGSRGLEGQKPGFTGFFVVTRWVPPRHFAFKGLLLSNATVAGSKPQDALVQATDLRLRCGGVDSRCAASPELIKNSLN